MSGFTRSLRDGFHHARIAALMALNGKFWREIALEMDWKADAIISYNRVLRYPGVRNKDSTSCIRHVD